MKLQNNVVKAKQNIISKTAAQLVIYSKFERKLLLGSYLERLSSCERRRHYSHTG